MDDDKRVRNPVTRSRGKVRGQFPSAKMQRMVAWESQLERRACYLFEFSSSIKSFREQPVRLSIPYEGEKPNRYTPDFEVIWDTGEISYVEIKPLSKLSPERIDYFNAIDRVVSESGREFIVITDEELNRPILENNLLLLRTYQRENVPSNTLNIINDFFCTSSEEGTHLSDVLGLVGSMKLVCALIAKGYLLIDFNRPLLNDSMVYLKKDNDNENCLFTYRTAPNFRGC